MGASDTVTDIFSTFSTKSASLLPSYLLHNYGSITISTEQKVKFFAILLLFLFSNVDEENRVNTNKMAA